MTTTLNVHVLIVLTKAVLIYTPEFDVGCVARLCDEYQPLTFSIKKFLIGYLDKSAASAKPNYLSLRQALARRLDCHALG